MEGKEHKESKVTASGPPEHICVHVKTNNKWGCLKISFPQDGQRCAWWITPHGIRANLRKTALASVFFQTDCQEQNGWGRAERGEWGEGGRDEVGWGPGQHRHSHALNLQDELSLRTSRAPELDRRLRSLGNFPSCFAMDRDH